MGQVWVVISNKAAENKLKSYVDSGMLEDAYSLKYALESFNDKIHKLVQTRGGHLHLLLYERVVLQIPESIAEEIPRMVEGYQDILDHPVAVGIGLNFQEATKAMNASKATGEIELFDPEKHHNIDPNQTSSDQRETDSDPTNDKDPFLRDHPPYNLIDRNGQVTDEPPQLPTAEEDAQMTQSMLQQTMADLGFQPPPDPMGEVSQDESQFQNPEDQAQMLQTNEPDQEQLAIMDQQHQEDMANFEPRNLLEALLGHSVPDEEHDEELNDEELEEDMYNEEAQMMPQEGAESPQEGMEPQEDSGQEQTLGRMLDSTMGKIPEMMQLASQDPKTFKQAMKFINRLMDLSETKEPTDMEKAEIQKYYEVLEKRFTPHAAFRGKGTHRNYPVGTRRDRKVKVKLPDGTTAWRSMSAGRVLDASGTPVSVKSYNADVKEDLSDGQ